jgi:predicted Zn-dependent peptidase
MNVVLTKLNNKASCLFVTDQNAPGFSIIVQFKAGARCEKQKDNGIAHLLEHMIFKGTKKTPNPKELAFKIENLGANVNASTSQEFTSYYISGPKENAIKIMRFLAELLMEPIFDDFELQKEKQVIFEEIRMYEDQPQDKVLDIFLKTLFGAHPLGRNIAGTIDTVTNLTADNCIDFINNNYSASNMLLVISGNFDIKEIEKELNNNFASWPEKDVKKDQQFEKVTTKHRLLNNQKQLEQTHLVIGGYFPGYKNMDINNRMAFSLGRVLLAGGFGSMLMQKIREELALSYYLYLHQEQFEETGYYAIGMGVNSTKRDIAISETI